MDLKGFDDEIYRRLNSGKLQPILDTLKTYHELGIWFEVINLVVPTYTDNLETIRRMCGWLVDNLGPDRPLHFSRFNPQHKLDHLPPTPIDILVQAREAARAAGLRYVYIGNVREVADAGTTYCPNCRRAGDRARRVLRHGLPARRRQVPLLRDAGRRGLERLSRPCLAIPSPGRFSQSRTAPGTIRNRGWGLGRSISPLVEQRGADAQLGLRRPHS